MAVGPIVEIAVAHSEAIAVVAFAAYIAYEIRLGAVKSVRDNQRTLGVALYRVIKRDEELDEEAFRDALWGGNHEALLFRDLNINGDDDDYP